MRINNTSLCLRCMAVLDNNGECPKCHYNQAEYNPPPRCLRPATVLADRYVVGCVIGEGSFGITYIGWDSLLEVRIAIKEFFPVNMVSRDTIKGEADSVYVYSDINDDEYQKNIKKFYEEAKILSYFNECEGIASVRDFFYSNNTAYMVMNYVEGSSLKKDIISRGSMKASDVLDIIKPVLLSLKKVHSRGLVHRDISPDNILVGTDGQLVLIDFGSARIRNAEIYRDLTITYKRGFSPEEQYRADGVQGPWSDIYAICATMYYMITGEMPVEAVKRLISDNFVNENRLSGSDISDAQIAAIYKGMAVNSEDRYQDIDALISDLYPAESDGGSIAPDNTGKKVKHFKIIKAIIVLSAFIIVVIIAELVIKNSANERKVEQTGGFVGEYNDNISVTPSPHPDTETEALQTMAPPLYTTLPDVTNTDTAVYTMGSFKNKTKKEAKTIIESYEDVLLEVTYRKIYSDRVKEGHIIKQSIKNGTECKRSEAKELVLYISKGQKTVRVPAVTGLNYDNAAKRLSELQLDVVTKWVYSDKQKGIVTNQSIPADTMVKKDTDITITVSAGSNTKKNDTNNKKNNKKDDSNDDFAGEIL